MDPCATQPIDDLVLLAKTVMVVAGIAGVCAFLWLFSRALRRLLAWFAKIPVVVYELLLVLSGAGLILWATTLHESYASSIGLLGSLFLGAGIIWIGLRHKDAWGVNVSDLGFILTLAWAVPAIAFDSPLIGAGSMAALMVTLGSSAFFTPGLIALGFEESEVVPRAAFAGFVVLGAFVALRAFGIPEGTLAPFSHGALYGGGVVAYTGVLTIACRWYASDRYVLRQIPAIIAVLAALVLGAALDLPELQKVGGTFCALYLLAKPFEIPTKTMTGYAVITLVWSLIACGIAIWVLANPQEAAPYVLFR